MSACSVSGTSKLLRSPVTSTSSPDLLEHAAIAQHAHRLDGVQRDPVGRVAEPSPDIVGEPGDEPDEELVHRVVAERLEGERRGAAVRAGEAGMAVASSGRASVRTKIGWWRPQSRRYSMKATSPSSAQWMSSNTMHERGPARPGARRSAARRRRDPRGRRPFARRDRGDGARRGSIQARSSASATWASSMACSFASRRARVLVLEDLRAPAHHLGQRPEGDALAVGEAAAAMPPDVRGDAVDVLLELPRRGATCRSRRRRSPTRAALGTGRRMRERGPSRAAARLAADERRLEARTARPSPRRWAATRSARESWTGSVLPLSSCAPASA